MQSCSRLDKEKTRRGSFAGQQATAVDLECGCVGNGVPGAPLSKPGTSVRRMKLRKSWWPWIALGVVTVVFYVGVGSSACILQGSCKRGAEGDDTPDSHPKLELIHRESLSSNELSALNSLRQSVKTVDDRTLEYAKLPPRPHTADDSIRCRTNGICEASSDNCHAGEDGLGCVTDIDMRRSKVVDAIRWAWNGYKQCAWGQDELLTMSCQGHDWFGLGLTLVDSLDTLILAGLDNEVDEAVKWVSEKMNVNGKPNVGANLFETTIRIVGGLMSAFHLKNGDQRLLQRAVQVAVRLLCAFNTPSGIPLSDVDLESFHARQPAWTASSSLSEVTTLSIEFSHIAQATSYEALAQPALHVWEVMRGMAGTEQGLAPIYIHPGARSPERHHHKSDNIPNTFIGGSPADSAHFTSNHISLGARGDSYYEYMLKQYIVGGKQDEHLLQMYTQAMQGVRNLLLLETAPVEAGGLMYVGERDTNTEGPPSNKMDHLVCFLPGVLALGHLHGINTAASAEHLGDLELAERLMHSCYEMYRQTPAGLSPEIVFFTGNSKDYPKAHTVDVGGGHFLIKESDSHNLLRPETVESLFVLHRVTGNSTYADWGWQIFRAFEKHTRWKSGGYTNLHSVLSHPPSRADKMESFFIAETLKYLFLLFSPKEVVPLDEYVFNTEAHPLPIIGSELEKSHRSWYLAPPQNKKEKVDLDPDSLRELLHGIESTFIAEPRI